MYLNNQSEILVLSRPKLGGAVRHFGVLLPNGAVTECVKPTGVHVTTLEAYRQGHDVQIEEALSLQQWPAVAARLQQALAERRPYHESNWNCECFANWLIGKPAVSKQAFAVAALLGLGLLFVAVRPKSVLAVLRNG